MQQRTMELAFLTEHTAHAEAVNYAAAERGWNVSTCAGRPNPVETLRSRQVDMVLVDLDLPNAIALLGELAQQLPQAPLLALATTHHLVESQDAQLAGAMDFVAFPINPQHFFATIERARQHFFATIERVRQASTPRADTPVNRMIGVVSLKGGVGRSTLATNLAIALRQRQSTEVILAEAHHGLGQLSLMMNLQPRLTLASLAAEANIDLDLLRGYLQPHQSGVRLLSAPGEPAQVVELSDEIWQRMLPLLTQLAPYVVVDTASAADRVLSQVLAHADDLLVLTDPTITGLRNTRALLETLHAEKERQIRIHVVLNQADVRGGLSVATIEKHLGEKIALTLPADPSLTTFACNRGVPFVLSHPHTQLSRQIHQLVGQLVKNMPVIHKQASRRTQPRRSLVSLFRS